MTVFLVIIFALDAFSSVMMIQKFARFYKIKNMKMCKYVAGLCFYFGAVTGILLWSYVIGLLVSAFTGDFRYFVNIAGVGSTISIFPCISGMLRMIGIEKRGCAPDCNKSFFDCITQSKK
ncbi:MAG: hypothetical protein FWH20_02725 [Oscillospiraceae bacterium]|nr:hypothetical protein [Oscillospiraceae bacterium]